MDAANKRRRTVLTVATVFLLLMALGVGAAAVFLEPYATARMDMSLMHMEGQGVPSTLYVRDPTTGQTVVAGQVLTLHRPYVYAPYEQLPDNLINAFVAIEDKRFFEHQGVDFRRTLHAALCYVKGINGGGRSFGGSTITQQLVKNLTERDEYTADRKLSEIFLALDMERQADKSEILTCYLNVINLANGCRGVGSAAAYYFDKTVDELTVAECAALAAITNHPTLYDPIRHPDNNRARREVILGEMQAQGYISPAVYREAMGEALVTVSHSEDGPTPVSSWYADMVAADVIRDLQERLGYTQLQASRAVYDGGLCIEVAMNPTLQAVVEKYYANENHFPVGTDGRPQSSMIIIDPDTGAILAVAGAVGVKNANRVQNYATDTRRPAGSAIKPLSAFAPALASGRITWSTVFEDEPQGTVNGRPWPRNADGLYHGQVTASTALSRSLNTVAVRLVSEAGIADTFDFLHDRLHMTGLQKADGGQLNDETLASLALGQQSGGVSVRELTAAYTVFDEGVYHAPISYYRVTDADGRVLLENRVGGEVVLSEADACVMTQMLRRVVTEGTAKSLTIGQRRGIEAAGKTGTSQNNCDRWFVGYTPRLLAGVWMGYDYPSALNGIVGNPCLEIWDEVMQACEDAYRDVPTQRTFSIHPDVVHSSFCRDSGGLPTTACEVEDGEDARVEDGWFVIGTEPDQICPLHHTEEENYLPQA